MEVRVTIKTTPGRPAVAALLMAGLLALAALAAWMVTQYKSAQPIELTAPITLPDLPLAISAPLGWVPQRAGGEQEQPQPIATFAEPGSSPMSSRKLVIYYHQTEQALSADTLIGEMYQRWAAAPKITEPLRLGPLPAGQALLVLREKDNLERELVRAALIGDRQYLVLRLICLGPPTPYEVRLMESIAESVTVDKEVYVPADRLAAGQSSITIGPAAGPWLAWRSPDKRPDRLVLLPGCPAPPDDKPPKFWGLVGLELQAVTPGRDLGPLLAERIADRPALPRPDGIFRNFTFRLVPGGGSQISRGRSGGGSRVSAVPPAQDKGQAGPIEQRTVGPLTVWRVRSVEKDLVRFRYLFRPLAGKPATGGAGGAGDEASPGSESAPGDSAQAEPGRSSRPGPTFSSQAVFLNAWSTANDEPAALAAIEQLVAAIRVP